MKEWFQPLAQLWKTHSSGQAVHIHTMGRSVFRHRKNDEKIAPSQDDQALLQNMEEVFYQYDTNSWIAPLPLRSHHLQQTTSSRLNSLCRTLKGGTNYIHDRVSSNHESTTTSSSIKWSGVSTNPHDSYTCLHLANSFWHHCRKEYLSTLQSHWKWRSMKPDIQDGDVVLWKDLQAKTNHWPIGVVKTYPSSDGQIRKADVKIVTDGTCRTYSDPY